MQINHATHKEVNISLETMAEERLLEEKLQFHCKKSSYLYLNYISIANWHTFV